ncbi:sodium/calcium exchanger 3 isoform X2 [Maylandia zebra]|uniref:Sodium/calcium exchanger 3 isoform X1 n=4 Tax=Haplochromini TaxID=319058 RepID=A0A3B4H3X0_9CICH|nr:PREDICTED: sodium/calcium exchanger 3 isoform X1 [Pundamilia nyererei]XP_005746561.1 PREDICTED: sodium/calcium exchanger 3 isoform X1 [Pundamilia nyererei]XP_005934066.1 sodium/calcium exchanger 3 isoform X1 [Haplochromis burtoni]XP_026007131.1 sodium/calcium exchanger 3 isoform X2 [Astatotilapia calliptera]
MEGSKPVKPGSSACLWLGLVSVAVAFLCTEARTTPSPLLSPSNGTCKGNTKCHTGIILPIWYPEDPSMGDKIARVIVYFVALIYMFLGVSIIADRFMAAIEVITSQEREIVIKRPNGETTTTTIRVWNETVSNLTLMALGSSAPEIMLSVIEVCGHEFKSGELGPSTIVGSAAFNMFVIIGLCVSVIPQGEVRKVKHLRVFFVTAGWSIFAYIWLYMILAVFSPNEVQVWEGLVTLAFFPICVLLAWVADRRLLFYKFMHKKYRTEKHRGVIIETETERSKGIEMDGKMVNSHFMDGGATSNLIGLIESKEVDESRRDMIRILKDLKQKHPEKELDQLVEMANYYALSHQQKSRAFYRIQATRMMTGAGNILKKHVAEQAKKSASVQEVHVEEPEEYVSRIAFEPAVYQCLENCGAVILTITRKGGDINKTIYVDYKTEDGSANAGADYEFTEGMVVFKPGEMIKEISIGIIDDDIFEEDEHFFVRLSNLRVLETEDEVLSANSLPYPKAVLGFPTVATVTILDDDHSGIFTFESNSAHVSESIGIMEVKVLRTSGARGTVIVPYRTVEGLAKGGGEDFEDTYGELEFKNDETCKFVHVKIIDDEEYEKNKNFFLELAEPRMVDMSLQKALLLADDVPDRKLTSDEEEAKRIAEMGKPVLGEHSKLEVIIEESYEFKSTVDKLIKKTNLALVVGTNSWREQFMEAITVSADEDEDDTGEERLPSCFDYVMHFLTVFWKVLFACVPPTDYMNGWACFTISIIIIGLLTAVIGDLASHFGCTIGLKDSVTAVVFVALGTSVPDTFASKVAAVQDTYADASIGNVTGSNAVNVFLGIGMAWSVAAIYWHMKGKPFVVEAGSLAFSVTLFTIFAFLAISVLLYRRRAHIGGELGGPRGHRLATSAFLFSLWFLYILFSSLEAYCHIEGF